MKVSRCPGCGAPVPPEADQCAYCQQYLIRELDEGAPSPKHEQQPRWDAQGGAAAGMTFHRMPEPNEQAFTLAVPHGWEMVGGITRANLMQQVIDAQSIEAKLDLTVQRDTAGTVAIRWCPEIKYCDMRMSPAGMMGMFPMGSTYQGMLVYPVMAATDFLQQMVIPWAHPQASDVQIVDRRQEPALVNRYRRGMAALGLPTNFQHDGGAVTLTYTEAGQRYHEVAHAVIEMMGPMAGGMWSNKDTVLLRAPQGEFETWEPVLRHIQASLKLNLSWLAQEIVNQEFLTRSFINAQQASLARDRRLREIQQQMQAMDRQITEHRMRTNAEIHNDAYLTLMEQEEYINPYTQEPEVGSNQWQYRWVTEGGEEFYTDNEEADPNTAGLFNCTDWRRTPVRPRFPD